MANWIIYGKVPEKYMPLLRKIDFDKVSTNRKPFKREKIVLTHPDIAQPELDFDPD